MIRRPRGRPRGCPRGHPAAGPVPAVAAVLLGDDVRGAPFFPHAQKRPAGSTAAHADASARPAAHRSTRSRYAFTAGDVTASRSTCGTFAEHEPEEEEESSSEEEDSDQDFTKFNALSIRSSKPSKTTNSPPNTYEASQKNRGKP